MQTEREQDQDQQSTGSGKAQNVRAQFLEKPAVSYLNSQWMEGHLLDSGNHEDGENTSP